ncbi:hypothetical protein TNCV_2178191 [Trichonephila clavipes]|uniref:Uncharacterized protein n=1 Tax=Trichonephila clavipes TaxID=2585209 RepID=A0A8X6VU71_TRICX|nr:hypothetical protein TNCV_2178191 [Trichonephila clavipes]
MPVFTVSVLEVLVNLVPLGSIPVCTSTIISLIILSIQYFCKPPIFRSWFTPSRSEVVFLKLSGSGNSAFLLAAAFAYLFARILATDSVENRVSF